MRTASAMGATVLALAASLTSSAGLAAPPTAPPAPLAVASTPEQQAAELKKLGDSAMDALRYDDALDAYTKAYALSPDPALLYNRGRVHQARGEWPEALADVEQFARDASAELRARVPRLDELLAETRAHVSTLELVSNVSGARVLVRDKQLGVTPLPGPVKLAAGPAHVEVLAAGYFEWRKDVDLPGGGHTSLDVILTPRATSGVLRVTTRLGTRVTIDDQPTHGAAAEAILNAGVHRVLVHADGYDDTEATFVIVAGETKDVDVEPRKRPPITATWWFWTGVGAVVVAGVVTSYALLTDKPAGTGDHFQPGQVSAGLMRW